MKENIMALVEDYWRQRLPGLQQMATERSRQIENLLVREEHERSGRKGDRLGKALGGFGLDALDLGSLSTSLTKAVQGRPMQKERLNRLQGLSRELEAIRQSLAESPPACRFMELGQGPEAITAAFGEHMAPVATTFRTFRIAEVEATARYEAEEHGPYFETFDWRQLDNEEMALCPPLVVFAEEGENPAADFTDLLQLLTVGKPVKVVLLRTGHAAMGTETGREAALKATIDPELLFLSLRNIYVCQSSSAAPKPLDQGLAGVLDSPRPGVFSVFSENGSVRPGRSPAAEALAARAFPHFTYDPDRAPDFVSCLDLSENPAPEEPWSTGMLKHKGEDGTETELERPLTFADFALGEPAFRDSFTSLAPNGSNGGAVPLWEFLKLSPEQRKGKHPFVYAVDDQQQLVRLAPSQSITVRAANKMHLWHTLQELCGIGNPYVQAAEQKAVQRLVTEKEESLNAQKVELEARISTREQEAVGAAMKNLALRLTGMAPLQPTGQPAAPPPLPTAQPAEAPPPGTAAPAEPAAAEPRGEISEVPWIETKLCTTCDECTTINKKIFAYDAKKKAIIKDPRGGPFRDIVRAAEKCSSGAIHPGKPLDPNEKDLEKWITRAEPFQ